MAKVEQIKVPDIGGATNVAVIEILVKPGDNVSPEQSLITLESEKATMEVPAPFAGKVKEIQLKVGDGVSEGSAILLLEVAEEGNSKVESKQPEEKKAETKKSESAQQKSDASVTASQQEVRVPDIGGASHVEVIEILVKPGDEVESEQSLITLESEKATMEVPSPFAGKVKEIKIKVGDKVSEGDLILMLATTHDVAPQQVAAQQPTEKQEPSVSQQPAPKKAPESTQQEAELYASPLVRRLIREFDLNVQAIQGSGRKGRLTKEDIQKYVKSQLEKANSSGLGIAPAPAIDFSKFGAIETKALNKIKRLTGQTVHRSWVTVPHVTQFGEADITELETFRKSQKSYSESKGVKLTPLVFLMKAVVVCLKAFPLFNSSLDSTGENLILKKYFHIGIAVDTPNGLVVPVIRDVDTKSMFELAQELGDISKKAREKGLSPADMAGSCFTISSLGGIGGTAFTPIVKSPDVAILGVSKSSIKPVYEEDKFIPRLMLPLSLSYDHRVIDGADGARFMVHLCECLADIRTLLL